LLQFGHRIRTRFTVLSGSKITPYCLSLSSLYKPYSRLIQWRTGGCTVAAVQFMDLPISHASQFPAQTLVTRTAAAQIELEDILALAVTATFLEAVSAA
jgi:hypothetical protein